MLNRKPYFFIYCLLFTGSFFCLFYKLHKADDLRFGFRIYEFVKHILGKGFSQMFHHIKAFPPTIKNLPADRMPLTARFAIGKRNRPTQPGTSFLEMIDVFIHDLTGFVYLDICLYVNFLFFKSDSNAVENSVDKSTRFFGTKLLSHVNCFVNGYF